MKKNAVLVCIIFLVMVMMDRPAAGTGKKEEPGKDFHKVEKVEPVPGSMKAGFDAITTESAEAYMRFLASDLLEGRDTTTKMYKVSAHFAATLFRMWEIKPMGDILTPRIDPSYYLTGKKQDKKKERSYLQAVAMKETLESESSLVLDYRKGPRLERKTFQGDEDFFYYYPEIETLTAPVVFAGYGISEKSIKFDEYKGLDVRGKIVLVLNGDPGEDCPDSPFNKGKLKGKYRTRYPWNGRDPKVKLVKEKGAAAILMLRVPRRRQMISGNYDERPIIPWETRKLSLIKTSLPSRLMETFPVMQITSEMADKILGFAGLSVSGMKERISRDLKPQSRQLPGITITIRNKKKTQKTGCVNVLGMIEGSDPELKEEVVVIGAHLDHLGKMGDYIFNGADDNASGSAGVLAAARAFAFNPVKPKRSILFALWTGEEKGLLGSRYYIDHPAVPLEKTMAHLNLDCVGRDWESREVLTYWVNRLRLKLPPEVKAEQLGLSDFMAFSVDKDSPEMYDSMKTSNRYVGLTLYIRKGRASSGSDHVSFARKNIPWGRFVSGMHGDGHEPGDYFGKINFELLRNISRLTYLTAFHLANK